jgi:hypothetical protein
MRFMTRHLLTALFTAAAIGALAVSPAAGQAVAPASQNVKTIAGILAKLNHFANDAEKKTLQTIVDSTTATAHEKTLAQALIGVNHTVTAADKPKLEALAKDQSAPEPVRTMATILASLNHTASEAQKAQLTKMAATT